MRLAVFALAPLLVAAGPLTKPSLERVCGIYRGAIAAHPKDADKATAFVNLRRDSIYNKDRSKTALTWDGDVLIAWTAVVAGDPSDRIKMFRAMAKDLGQEGWVCADAEKLFQMQAATSGEQEDPIEIATSTAGLGTVAKGSLEKDAIARTVKKHQPQIRACYERILREKPDAEGVVKVRFNITPAGSVSEVVVAESTLAQASVESCIISQVKTWKFPKPKGGKVVVTYPFSFKRAAAN